MKFMRKQHVFQTHTARDDGQKKLPKKSKYRKSLSFIAIVFDLESTLIKSSYKKHKLVDNDSYIYVNILGTKRIRVILF